ncbi:MAG: hypothetical protein ACO3JG_00430 [Luteolibacter sp.]
MDPTHETTPDELLDTFRGRSLKSIILFTLAVHAVVLLGTSVPFLWKTIAGPSAELTEEQRVQAAVKEATASLRKIAERHGIPPQDLGSQFAAGSPAAPAPAATPETTSPETATPDENAASGDEPKSAIEEEIEKAAPGPEVPPIPEEEVDLFK